MRALTANPFWARARRWFRGLRIGLWLGLLALLCAGLYCNQIGLPEFVLRRVIAELRARGIEFETRRVRLRWYRGLVADDVRFGRTADPGGPKFSAREVDLRLSLAALRHGQLQPSGLVLRAGRLAWPLDEPTPARELVVEDAEARLRFLPGDQWEVDHFQARFAGARLRLTGTLTNASAVRQWRFRPATPDEPAVTTPPEVIQERLRWLADTLARMRFLQTPELTLSVCGDAADYRSFHGAVTLRADDAETPWGAGREVVLIARVFPPTNQAATAEFRLSATEARTPWVRARELRGQGQVYALPSPTNRARAQMTLSVDEAEIAVPETFPGRRIVPTPPGSAAPALDINLVVTNLTIAARWTQAFTNPIPLAGEAELQAATANSPWGRAHRLAAAGDFARRPEVSALAAPPDPALGWWTNLAGLELAWRADVGSVVTPQLQTGRLCLVGIWTHPELTLTNLHAELYGGTLDASARLNVTNREAAFALTSNFDVQGLKPMLTPAARAWLEKFAWERPPRLRGAGAVVLPAWTNPAPDWRVEVQPTLRLRAEFAVGRGAYRGVAVESATGQVTYTNLLWHLPELVLTRPEGRARLEHWAHDRTKDYYWRGEAWADPKALRPVLEAEAQQGLDYFQFQSPPAVTGEVWGRYHAPEHTRFRADVLASNFVFRGEQVELCRARLEYTNLWLQAYQPEVRRSNEWLRAESVIVELARQRVVIRDGFSTADPQAVARAFGQRTAAALAPYGFASPPTARVEGVVGIHDPEAMDLHFTLRGNEFAWWKFNLPHVDAELHWRGNTLLLTNVQADAYAGRVSGNAFFDFHPRENADFQFHLNVADVDLHRLMSDISRRTNQLEGRISGWLHITRANTDDWQSWNGHGRVTLRDGLLWEIPLFGIFSPLLNAMVPGLGNTRFSDGTADFTLTNSVIHSRNLEIRAPMIRMHYRGTVDFTGQLDARFEAELLRDFPVLGPVMSLVLSPLTKLFEYRVTGTLQEPKTEPVYVPKLFLFPLRPFKTLRDLLPTESGTNAPAPPTP